VNQAVGVPERGPGGHRQDEPHEKGAED
jgi:hypothetical protein